MNNCQFKFKPDKIKYLSNIDTLDSTHKKTIENINKKHEDVPKKIKRLEKLKSDLVQIDLNSSITPNYISVRTRIIDDINKIEEDICQVENYEDELEYYSKTYDILFNYYNIIDGMNQKEIIQIQNNLKDNFSTNISNINTDIENDIVKIESNIIDYKIENDSNNNGNNGNNSNDNDNGNDNYNGNDNDNDNNNNENDENNDNDENIKKSEILDFDGIQIFNNKSSKLDLLNQISKMKRKEKKVTRKRVKNVESLIKDNNNIFDYIEGNKSQNLDSKNTNQIKAPVVYDRATLYEDYKIMIDGYPSKKKISKPCINCGIDKILIYNEGIYACMKCGEVENCIIESEVTNYKDPMVEKPTFPYKRKNHFCEWTEKYNCSLKLIINKLASIIYSYKILL